METHMGLKQEKHSLIEYPRVKISKETRLRARFLINTHYTKLYGPEIRLETTRSIRVKIMELESHMEDFRRWPAVFQSMAKQCRDFERICSLIEILD